jgi:molybdopterin-guanine dinucleotide biosynthesis protein B
MPFVLAVSGLKNSGKTTLCGVLLEMLREKGLRCAYVKHGSHRVCSAPGTDTGKFVEAGFPSVWWGEDGLRVELGRVRHALSGAAPSPLDDGEILAEMTSRFFPGFDLVLLEGGKHLSLPRIWVGAPETVPESVRGIIAFYGDKSGDGAGECAKASCCQGENVSPCGGVSRFSRGEEAALAEMVEKLVLRGRAPLELYVGSSRLPMKFFVAEFIRGALEGMLRSLKGGTDFRRGILLAVPPDRGAELDAPEETRRRMPKA